MNEIATLAGGCFWCTEALFRRLKGVSSVVPGYSGGSDPHPTYDKVCEGQTGHAEAIQIIFNSVQISYEKILEIFFFTHNPTTLNQQGNDRGTQYRSVIFYHDEKQKATALKVKEKIEKEKVYENPLVTELVPFTHFYPAEDYHKSYFDKNKTASYCDVIISSKIHKLLNLYSNEVKEEYKKE